MTALVAQHLKKAYQGREVVSELSLLVSPWRDRWLTGSQRCR